MSQGASQSAGGRTQAATSLRYKLQRAYVVTIGVSLTLVTVALTYVQFDDSRAAAIESNRAVAEVIAENLGATVLFQNSAAAEAVLRSLNNQASLIGSAVYQPDGTMLASFPARDPMSSARAFSIAGAESGKIQLRRGHKIEDGKLILTQPITVGAETVGVLVMRAGLQSFFQWFQSTAIIVLPILLASIFMAGMLARGQVNAILSPLDVFRQAMRCVGEGRTAGLYMPEVGDRELLPMVNGFNEMVEQLHSSRRALSESEERYRRIVESQTEGICRLDRRFQLSFANPAFLEMVGYEVEALLGERPARLVPPKDCRKIEEAHAQLSPANRSAGFSCRLLTSEGEIRWVEATLSAVFDDQDRISEYLIVARDVSKQKIAEQMTIQTSKLASLGEISTSIAHELKQPLSVMDMIAQNMMDTLREEDLSPEEMKKYALSKAERIASNTTRLRSIIEHLRMFGRKVDGEPEVFDSRESLKAAVVLIQHRLDRANIRLRKTMPSQSAKMRGHTTLFEQVLLNLLNNAADALEEQPCGQQRLVTVDMTCADGLITVVVEDSAGGMPEAVLRRAQEPYFTTKPPEKGTGLGLSISSDILRGMDGNLSLANGTSGLQATITLPLVVEAKKRQTKKSLSAQTAAQ